MFSRDPKGSARVTLPARVPLAACPPVFCAESQDRTGSKLPVAPGAAPNQPEAQARALMFGVFFAILAVFVVAVPLKAAGLRPPSQGGPQGGDQDRFVVIKTKKTITISGEEIKDAVIVVRNGKIDAVGKNVSYPSESKVIDASHLVAMPGLVNPYSKIGLPVASAPRGRRSGNKSHLKLADRYYPPEDETYLELLEAGYTTLGLYPDGTGLPGQGLVVATHDPKPKSGLKTDGLVRIGFTRPSRDKKVLKGALKAAQDQIDKEKKAASKPAEGAKKPAKGGKPAAKGAKPATQPATKPTTKPTTKPAAKAKAKPAVKPELVPVISLLKKADGFGALIEFSRASDVVHFEDATGKFEFPRAYLFVGPRAADAHHVADHELLGKAKALVGLPPTLPHMPLTVNPYNRVKEFIDAGCEVAVFPAADTVLEHERIRERLAFLVRAGLDRKDALKAVTLNAAKMLTLDKRLGSIEKDKQADLIFLDGDPLDPFAKVQRVMINGEMVLNLEKSKR